MFSTVVKQAIGERPALPLSIITEHERMEMINTFRTQTQAASEEVVQRVTRHAEELIKTSFATIRLELERMQPTVGILKVEVNGIERDLKHQAAPCLGRLLLNAKLGLNSLLVGPAGCGKTTAAEQAAEALGLEFGHLGLTAGASETWLFGRQTPNGFVEASFSRIYRNGGVFLADEMDAADPNLLLAINTALANQSLYNPISGEHLPKHKDFVFIGAMNTFGRGSDGVYSGRNRLDAATLDRFVMIAMDYDEGIERQVCPDPELRGALLKVRSRLRDLKSPEVVSTRTLSRVYAQVQNGVPLNQILESMTLGWPESIVSQLGLKK